MPSTNKTSLGLNQWVLSDQPVMSDFNSDNAIVDAAISALQKPIDTDRIADGAVTTPKIEDGAVTVEKLSGYPGTYLSSDDIDDVTVPGLYVLPSGEILFVYTTSDPVGTAQMRIDTQCRVIYRNKVGDSSWSPPQYYIVPDNSITTAKIVSKAVTADKLADDVIPSELPADKLLAGAGGRAMQATPYAVRTVESVLRIAKDTAGMPPKTISVPLLSSYVGDTPCSLYFEARAVSGSTASLSPAGNSDAGFISGWTTSGAINGGEWGSFSVENKTGFTGLSILLSSDQAASVDFRNVRVVDAAGNDYVDHTAFEAQGTIVEVLPDTPETDATDIPTVAGVKALLAELEARIAALEGGEAE